MPKAIHRIFPDLAIVLASTFLFSCGDPDSAKKPANFDLESLRENLERGKSASTPDPETGLVTEAYPLTTYQALNFLGGSEEESDAPAAPVGMDTRPVPENLSTQLQERLEVLGIGFPEGTSATYDSASDTLTVTQTPVNLPLVRKLLPPAKPGPAPVSVRFEIYEVPALLALRLEESASAHEEHTPEWEALQKTFSSGDCRLLETILIQSRSGQRSRYESGEQVVFVSGFSKDPENPDEALIPVFETRTAGTLIEVDPIARVENEVIDLSLSFEYHSAPAEFRKAQLPGKADSLPQLIDLPVFHEKRLITQLAVFSGDIRLLASWTPTGKPEYLEMGVRHLVFLFASIPSE